MDNKQIAITEFGGPEVLVIQTSDVPQPKAGEVLVKVAFAGVNPIDVKTRAGLGWAAAQNKDKLPWVPGYDISGQVVEVGEDNRRFQIGDNVAGFVGFPLRGGGYS
ncbi:alcohol dehydrogenase catalytic domain-containing protein, partial [Vibrio anguillarum]